MAVQEKRALQCGPYVYYPDESLGQGSFAEVFKGMGPDVCLIARCSNVKGVAVAVKRIAKSKLTRPSNQRLLQSEIAILQVMCPAIESARGPCHHWFALNGN